MQFGTEPLADYLYQRNNNQLTQAGGIIFRYDSHGNMVQRSNFNYIYDDENRLINATNGTMVNTYIYDANGLRAVKKDSQGTTIYIYDFNGNNIYEENVALQ